MRHPFSRTLTLSLALTAAAALAAEPEAPRDYLAEFNELRASIDAPPIAERSSHTDFLTVADALNEDERRRSEELLAAHATDFERVQQLDAERRALTERLDVAMERWMELEELEA